MNNMPPKTPWIRRIVGVVTVVALVMMVAVMATACQNGRGDISDELPTDTTSAMPSLTTAPSTATTTAPSNYMDKEAVKQVAFDHAGVKADDAAKVRCKLLSGDNGDFYEVSFVFEQYSYGYDIDAVTGEVLANHREWQNDVDWGNGDWGDNWHLGDEDSEEE